MNQSKDIGIEPVARTYQTDRSTYIIPDDMVVYVVGRKRLQNELLSDYLSRKTKKNCQVFEDINKLPFQEEKKRLVIWDCQDRTKEDIRLELRLYNIRRKSDNHLVLLNVPPDLKFQKEHIFKGIHGLIHEQDSLENLVKGVQAVVNGKLWLPRDFMARCIFEEMDPEKPDKGTVELLSKRQIEILSMIVIGATNKEISEQLYISTNTVKNHLYAIFKKINVSSRIQALFWAATNL